MKALSYFSDLTILEIEAVYGLRCALAHDYALVNKGAGRPDRRHRFSIRPLSETKVVELPEERWNGTYQDSSHKNMTVIDVVALGDLVEDVCCKIVSMAKMGELEIELDGGYEELELRYMFVAEA